MKTLLHLDSSLRPTGSVSRQLTAHFANAWKEKFPGCRIIYCDFAIAPLPHLTSAVVASYKEAAERTAADIDALQPLADAAGEPPLGRSSPHRRPYV